MRHGVLGFSVALAYPEQKITPKAERRKEDKPKPTLWELSGCRFSTQPNGLL
ncbi:MAG: hypothetical protein N2646_02370 [Bellilinea sp.]|nr:hypothetical protein [Bellilinea sp.]